MPANISQVGPEHFLLLLLLALSSCLSAQEIPDSLTGKFYQIYNRMNIDSSKPFKKTKET